MTLKGKYINGHIELIDHVQIKENADVEIHILDEDKVEPMKITFEKSEDEREKRLRKAAERLAPLYENDEELQAFKKIESEPFHD